MAMVTIHKDKLTRTVPMGAYVSQYASLGWSIGPNESLDGDKGTNTPPAPKKPLNDASAKPESDAEQVDEPDTEELEEEEEDVEYIDPEDLKEKPLNELDYEELRILAEYLGISLKGLKNKKAVKQAIEEFQGK